MSACCCYSRCSLLLSLSEPELDLEQPRWHCELDGQDLAPLQLCSAAVRSALRAQALQSWLL